MFPFPNPLLDILTREAAKRSKQIEIIGGGLRGVLPNIAGPMRAPNSVPGAQPRGMLRRLAPPTTGQGFIGPKAPPTDPLSELFQQLLSQLQQSVNVPTGIDEAGLMKQVRSAIDPIYDQRSQEAENRTTRGRAEVQNMYKALAAEYERLAPEQEAQARQAQADVEQLYGQLRSNIEGNFSRVSKEQADTFKQLGIEDALPDVMQGQQEATTDALNSAAELGAINEQRYLDQANIDKTYYTEGSPLATMTGVNTSKDMLFELNEYLNQLEAERTSGIQSTYTDLMGQAQNNLMQQQQAAQQENARRQSMLWEIFRAQMESQNQPAGKLDVNSFMGSLPPNLQQSVGSAFIRLQRSPEAIYGKTLDPRNPVPGTFVETTPQWYMAQADEMLKRGEIDESTYQALQMYLQLYFGG